MPSQTKENYLKAIFFLSDKDGNVSLSELSKELGVSTPTANSMVKRLQEEGWVRYQKYKPLKVTPEGKKAAALIIRKHRIVEMFLVEKMGFGWEEVHDIAEQMEHIRSEELFERMDEMLGNPRVDPHGSPIPDKEGRVKKEDYQRLSDTEVGSKVRLRALSDSSKDLLILLNAKQVELGTEMNLLTREPFDESVTVSIGTDAEAVFSKEVCERLLVEPCEPSA